MNAAEQINQLGIKVDLEALRQYRTALAAKEPGYGRPEMTAQARKSWVTLLTKIEQAATELTDIGIMHPQYAQGDASTGRWTCQGTNMMGIPTELRHLFVAREGYELVTMDYSQVQYRILATLAGETTLLDQMTDPDFDIHQVVATDLGITRKQAKVVNYGIIFGMTGFGVGTRCGQSEEWGQEVVDRWFTRYPAIATYIRSIHRQVRMSGTVSTPGGRTRTFEVRDSKAASQAVCHVVQGTEAELATAGVERLQAAGYRVVGFNHDEVVVEVPAGADVGALRTLWQGVTPYLLATTLERGRSWM